MCSCLFYKTCQTGLALLAEKPFWLVAALKLFQDTEEIVDESMLVTQMAGDLLRKEDAIG